MSRSRFFASSLLPWIALAVLAVRPTAATELPTGSFTFEKQIVVPGAPAVIYDAMTGDVSGWWDHHFSEHPKALYIEAKPGGGFYEIFDDSGDGAKHAEVIFAKRGEILKMRGPLGFSGNAIDLVHTFRFAAEDDSTRVTLTLNAVGQLEEGWQQAAEQVWDHFLVEQFKTWVEAGRHLAEE
ncbi:MAG: SRPBCC family protein [Candidatus Eiseniibacteriota bacterium]